MDIVEFFQLSSGKWFSQRTSHNFMLKQSESGKSDIQVALLDKADPAVIRLCEQSKIDPELALCGARLTWQGTTESDPKQMTGSTLLVPIADAENPNAGRLLREMGGSEQGLAGRYSVGSDEAVTLIIENDTLHSEERVWFASPNLRFRSSVLKHQEEFTTATFYSEIRLGLTQPQPPQAAMAKPTGEQA